MYDANVTGFKRNLMPDTRKSAQFVQNSEYSYSNTRSVDLRHNISEERQSIASSRPTQSDWQQSSEISKLKDENAKLLAINQYFMMNNWESNERRKSAAQMLDTLLKCKYPDQSSSVAAAQNLPADLTHLSHLLSHSTSSEVSKVQEDRYQELNRKYIEKCREAESLIEDKRGLQAEIELHRGMQMDNY